MKYSCCTALENLPLLEAAGYDRIILPCTQVAGWSEAEFEKALAAISGSSLECRGLNSFCTPELRLCGPGYDAEKVEAYIRHLAPRAKALGVEFIGVGSPKSRSIPEDYDRERAMEQWIGTLEILCGVCREYGITVLLEAVCALEGNFMTTTNDALEVLNRAGISNLEIVFDTYHAFMMDEDEKPLVRAMDHVKLIHMAQDFSGRRHYLRRENMAEYRVYTDALRNAGFDGEVAVEAFYDDIREQLPETLAIMKELFAQ